MNIETVFSLLHRQNLLVVRVPAVKQGNVAWLAVLLVGGAASGPLAGCSGSDQPTYRGDSGCMMWSAALCADARKPMVFRDGDPVLDMCAGIGIVYDQHIWNVPIQNWAFPGTTRVTASYDGEGRVTSIESDCGLDEPWLATLEWNDDGRLARRRADWAIDRGIEEEITPVYADGRLAAHEIVRYYDDGSTRDMPPREYTLDELGRLETYDTVGPWATYHHTFEYEGDDLSTIVREESLDDGRRFVVTSAYSYDDEGRLIEIVETTEPDSDVSGPRVIDIEWTSATSARLSRSNAPDAWMEVKTDDEGRLVRKESYSDAVGHRAMTWERDGDGRLVEFWMYGE